jgi:hypothetical protein
MSYFFFLESHRASRRKFVSEMYEKIVWLAGARWRKEEAVKPTKQKDNLLS